MKPLLSIQSLAVGYKNINVAEDINLQLEKGSFSAIVGPNGIGKSTLLRTLAGLQPKMGGAIHMDQKPLETYNPVSLAKQVALVLTETPATKNLTVHELLSLGRQPYTNWLGMLSTSDKQKIEQSISNFGLEKLVGSKCYELSDGQLQRVFIARAVVQDTPIVLLDEPTTHLDLANKVRIFKLLQKLSKEHNKLILFTSHEINLTLQLCDHLLIMDGKENPFGQPEELVESGNLSSLFPSEIVHFDKTSGTFKVNQG